MVEQVRNHIEKILGIDDFAVVVGPKMISHDLGMVAFIEAFLLKANGEGFECRWLPMANGEGCDQR